MRSVRPWISVIFLTFGISVFVLSAGCTRHKEGQPAAGAKAVQSAPRFRLESASGKQVSLEDYAGKAVLVHFWASWCPPCLPELPHVISFAAKMQAKGWTVLAVSTDTDWQKAKAALPAQSALPSNFVVLLDANSKTAESYGSYMYPESYWIDGDGKILRKWVGPQDWDAIASSL